LDRIGVVVFFRFISLQWGGALVFREICTISFVLNSETQKKTQTENPPPILKRHRKLKIGSP
jgi:hypothetical protein